MTLKFFSIFMGASLSVALMLVAVVRNMANSFKAYGKKPLVIAAITVILDAVIAFGITDLTDDPFFMFWGLAIAFLVFGIIHHLLMHHRFSFLKSEEKMKIFFAEILFVLSVMICTVVIFSVMQYFLKDTEFMFYPLLLSVLAFIIPLFFYKTFEAAYNIPGSVFSVWEYPIGQVINPPEEVEGEKVFDIVFEIPKKATDEKKTYFRALTPENINLGELFYHFINDYNQQQSEKPIQITTDDKKKALVWWFRLKRKWYQSHKILDPALSVKYNGVKENSVIICEHFDYKD